jgi:hypothetical protein
LVFQLFKIQDLTLYFYFADAVAAIDGSKFKGVNNKDNKPTHTLKKLPFPFARVEKYTHNYRS